MGANRGPDRRGDKAGAGGGDPVEFDRIDERLIAGLRENGRIANRDLARLAQVNEATVRSRLRRLDEAQAVRVVAMCDFNAMGYEALAAVGVQVKGRSAAAVGADLAAIEEVVTVNVAIGQHDLEIQVIARDLAALEALLTDRIARIEGVERLFPGLALKVLKYNSEWAPL